MSENAACYSPEKSVWSLAPLAASVYGIIGMGGGPAMSICCAAFTLVSFIAMCVLLFTIGTKQAEVD